MKNSRIFILACGIICSLIMGFAYTYSIVQPYIMDYFSIASYMASLPYTIFLALFVVGNYVGGVMQKKHSVKMIMLIGYLLMAAGLFSTSILPSSAPAGMWFTYGTLLGIGDGMVYNVIIAMMQKWFPDKKGLATGITLAVLGVSATILSPLSSTWLTNYGFTGTFRILAVIFAVVAVFGMLTIKAPPAGYMADYKPSGAVAVSKNTCTRLLPVQRILSPQPCLFLRDPGVCASQCDLRQLWHIQRSGQDTARDGCFRRVAHAGRRPLPDFHRQ